MSIKAILSTIEEKMKQDEEDFAFKIYISEAIKAIGMRKCLTMSYYDLINPKPVDTRSAQEIADDLTNRINNG